MRREAPPLVKPSERRDTFAEARLYLCTPGHHPTDVLAGVVEAGVDVVQLRIKDAEAAEIIEIGESYMAVCEDRNVPFVINDRPDIALALAADGVHLGQDDLPPFVAREILGPDVIIGRSTHSVSDIERALREHADGLIDYIAVGPVHETPTKQGRPAVGVELVAHAAQTVDFPWFAIGGIDKETIGAVTEAGAARIVVVRAITEAEDPIAAVGELRGRL
jgi:thiamine-phosphate pyrophosphorylase